MARNSQRKSQSDQIKGACREINNLKKELLEIKNTINTGIFSISIADNLSFSIILEAASQLQEFNISCEVIDVQTLIPFDIHHTIVHSIQKTNKVVFELTDNLKTFNLQNSIIYSNLRR